MCSLLWERKAFPQKQFREKIMVECSTEMTFTPVGAGDVFCSPIAITENTFSLVPDGNGESLKAPEFCKEDGVRTPYPYKLIAQHFRTKKGTRVGFNYINEWEQADWQNYQHVQSSRLHQGQLVCTQTRSAGISAEMVFDPTVASCFVIKKREAEMRNKSKTAGMISDKINSQNLVASFLFGNISMVANKIQTYVVHHGALIGPIRW